MSLEALAKALYDAVLTPKPSWDQLGDVTKSVWLDIAAGFNIFNDEEDLEMPGKINIKTIQARLDGVPITGEFIATTLGIEPVEREKRLVLWADEQYPEICDKLCAHIKSKRASTVVADKPEPKAKKGDKKAGKSDEGFNFGDADAGDSDTASGSEKGFDFGGGADSGNSAGGADAAEGFDFDGGADAEEGEFKF